MASAQVISTPAVDRAAAAGSAILDGRDLWSDVESDTARTILQAAVRAFADNGYHGTNLRKIIDGTGLSTAALYVHFASKEDVLFEISRRGYAATAEIVDRSMASSDPADALRAMVYTFTRWQAQNHTTARVVFYEEAALTPEHTEALLKIRMPAERRVQQAIKRGIDKGAFLPGDVRGVTGAILSLSIDVARWYGPGAPYTPDSLGRLYSMLAARMVGLTD